MPVYGYVCNFCGFSGDRYTPVDERGFQVCECGQPLQRLLSAPLFRFAGRVTPGGGPDRFTADMLGVPLKELPEGLKTKE